MGEDIRLKCIGVIAGTKASDAYLCAALAGAFPHVRVVRYKMPFSKWLPWILKRIRMMGVSVLAGHLLLSTYLRLQRLLERMRGRSLWRKYGVEVPRWGDSSGTVPLCAREETLIRALRGVDAVVALDAVRLSHRFFRAIPKPFVQIVWGALPDYAGDSGAFWAYAKGDRAQVGVSIVLHRGQFNHQTRLRFVPIECSADETIRTIKVKQVIALGRALPETVRTLLADMLPAAERICQEVQFTNWSAPTLITYLQFLRWRVKRGLFRIQPYAVSRRYGGTLCTITSVSV